MKRFRLTKLAKTLIFFMVMCVVAGGIVYGTKSGIIKSGTKENESTVSDEKTENEIKKPEPVSTEKPEPSKKSEESKQENEINLSLDEWIGWKSIIDANKGLTTQPGSIYDNLGIKVNIHVINDATQSSNALIKGDLDAAGYTINRTAFLSEKFKTAGIDVVMPFVTNYSNGGDGIIATDNFKTIESLVDARIGVPQFSEAHSLVVWFVNQSDLPNGDKQKIIDNLLFFDTPDEAAMAFFAGQIDVAATWQPYLTQALNTSNCHVLFSTASSTKLILDGILFREDFAKNNPELVSKFIDGALQAADVYSTEFDAIREVMPMFSGLSDDDIKGSTEDAALAGWKNNMETLKSEAPSIYTDMCEVWTSIGENVEPQMVNTLFDTSYMESLSEKYDSLTSYTNEQPVVKVTEENKQEIIDTEALLTKSATVEFEINTSIFKDTAKANETLNDFIKIAKLLDGSIIQIEGNTDPNPKTDPTDEANLMLSKQRADAVKQYFIMSGISADRIITVGNGSSNPIVENDTEEHRAMNRRTDVTFKCIE